MRTTGRNCAESHAERVVYIVFGSNGNTHLGKHKDKETCESFSYSLALYHIAYRRLDVYECVGGIVFICVQGESKKEVDCLYGSLSDSQRYYGYNFGSYGRKQWPCRFMVPSRGNIGSAAVIFCV